MIDKKTENSINLLIKKLKDENLGSLKFSNKTISIEISNNLGSVQIALYLLFYQFVQTYHHKL